MNPALHSAKLGCVEARTLCASGPHSALPGAGLGLPLSSEAECSSEDNKMGVLLKGQQRTAEPQGPWSVLSSGTPCEKDGVTMHTPLWLGKQQVRLFHPASAPHAPSV